VSRDAQRRGLEIVLEFVPQTPIPDIRFARVIVKACGDNALAETINGLQKAEVIHRRGPWRSFEAVEYPTLEWKDRFNNRRLLEPIGKIPPAEAEAQYYATMDDVSMPA